MIKTWYKIEKHVNKLWFFIISIYLYENTNIRTKWCVGGRIKKNGKGEACFKE